MTARGRTGPHRPAALPSATGLLAAPEATAAAPSARAALDLARAIGPVAAGRGALQLLAALYLFIVSLRLLSAAAGGVAAFLGELDASGPLNLLGFGWLLSYAALAGSPVAATALSLLDGGAIGSREALAMLSGSRLGASLIVLLVGFAAYARGRGRPDGIYVGVVALVTTATVYVPATALALFMLDRGWFEGVDQIVPSGFGSLAAESARPPVEALDRVLPGAGLFVAGGLVLIAAFWLFDRLLPEPRPAVGADRAAVEAARLAAGDVRARCAAHRSHDVGRDLADDPRAADAEGRRASRLRDPVRHGREHHDLRGHALRLGAARVGRAGRGRCHRGRRGHDRFAGAADSSRTGRTRGCCCTSRTRSPRRAVRYSPFLAVMGAAAGRAALRLIACVSGV